MAFNPNPSSSLTNKEDRTHILNATLSFLSANPCTFFPPSSSSHNLFIKAIKAHNLSSSHLVNLLTASPVDFPMNSSESKPPVLTPWLSQFKKPGDISSIFLYSWLDPLVNRKDSNENDLIKQEPTLDQMLLPIHETSISPAKENFVRLNEDYIRFHDVDFWLVFEKKLVKPKVEHFLEDLKSQFESINIVKIKQFYYLEKTSEAILVTGWKLFDETLVYDIINQTKKLLLTSQNQKLEFQIIQSEKDLRKHLKKVVLDDKLEQLGLFDGEFAKPLFNLQLQGLAYYEFDYVDLCPETVCVLCGLPPTMTDAELLDCFTEHVLPKPINILRNAVSEGPSSVRVSFADRSAADLLRFQGLKAPIKGGEFKVKPLIIIPVKNRNFDYLTELVKFQVKMDFEKESKLDKSALAKYLKELEARYGPISDVNMIDVNSYIVSFAQISSALKCLEMAKLEKFSLISKPSQAYPCSGYLFQNDLENAKTNVTLQRPPALVKADPSILKIPSRYFEKKLLQKKRYQKIYMMQQEAVRKKSSEELALSPSEFKYDQILTEGLFNHENEQPTFVEKSAHELIAEIIKPSSINTKRPSPAAAEEDARIPEPQRDVPEPQIEPEQEIPEPQIEDIPEPKIEQDDEDFEDFHIKILQPITDDIEFDEPKMEEHDQSTEIEQNDSKLIEQSSKPTKKLKTESHVSPKNKLEKKIKPRSSSKTKTKGWASSKTGKYLQKVVPQRMQVEDSSLGDTLQPKRSERLALKADSGKSKIYAMWLKNKKKKELKPKRKAIAKTKKRTHKRGPIEDGLYTRENPLINFMLNNFVKHDDDDEEEKGFHLKNEEIRNPKIEVKKELIEEEFGMRVEIEIPDMKALFLPRQLRQVKVISSKYMIKRPRQFSSKRAERAVEVEDKTKLLIQQNIEKIRNLIEINQDRRRKMQTEDKEIKVKFEEGH